MSVVTEVLILITELSEINKYVNIIFGYINLSVLFVIAVDI